MRTNEDLQDGFRLGEWLVYPNREEIARGDEVVRPQPKVFQVLMALARREGDLLTRDMLVDEVWGGRPTADDPINRSLSLLRSDLGDRSTPHHYVETVPRRGYRLVVPVEPLSEEPPFDASPPPRISATSVVRVVFIVALILVTAVALERTLNSTSAEPPESIAVLPFSTMSVETTPEYLAVGFKEELVDLLHNTGPYVVKSSNVLYEGEATDIAERLDVDNIVTGSVQVINERVKISYEVIDGDSGNVVAVGNLTGGMSGLFELQERVANRVHEDLLGARPSTRIETRRPPDPAAYMSYMRGLHAFENRIEPGNLERAIAFFEQTTREDSAFGPAYIRLANAYVLLPDNAPVDAREALDKAMAAAEQGKTLDEDLLGPASAVIGFVHAQRRDWQNAELFFQDAMNSRVIDANAHHLYSRMLSSVGRLEDATRQAQLAHELNPTSATITSRLALIHTWRGSNDEARQYFGMANELGAGGPTHSLGYAMLLYRTGELADAKAATADGLAGTGISIAWVDPVVAALRDPSRRDAALAVVNEEVAAGRLSLQIEVTVRSLLQDTEGAMAAADRLRSPTPYPFALDILWIRELDALRRHASFPGLMTALGIATYWESTLCEFEDARVSCAS
ncbi:MAG: winged helix-turn-helix domain-containing protein [Pseudomonadota bacterium]